MKRQWVWSGWVVAALMVSYGQVAWAQADAPEEADVEGKTAEEAEAPAQAPGAEQPPTEEAEAITPSPEGLISVDFKDADLRQVMRIISLKSGIDIVLAPDVEGLVTIKLTNVPWEQALDIILRTYGFAYERKGNVVRVMTLAAVDLEALSNEVFPLSYAKAKEVGDIVKEMLTDRGKVKFDERTNTVIITDIPSNLSQLKPVIDRLDQATPQVQIDTKVVETKLTKDDNLGIDWSNAIQLVYTPPQVTGVFPLPGQIPAVRRAADGAITLGMLKTSGTGTTDLTATLNALKQRVNTNIISNPTIVTLNNKEALVQAGEDINIPNFQIDPSTGRATVTGFQTRSTGVIFKVTPHVNPQNEIVLDVKPEITEVGATFDEFASGVKFPRFTVQKAETQVRLNNGETLVIGGLVKRKTVVTDDKVPLLGDIPILGALFTNVRHQADPHQDLLIFLTVKLVEEKVQQQAAMAAQPVSP